MQFVSDTPVYYILLCIIAATFFSFLLYYRNKHNSELTTKTIALLSVFRFSAFLIVCLLLCNFLIKNTSNKTESPTILFAVDNSSSVLYGKDSLNNKRLIEEKIKNLNSGLAKSFNVKQMVFGSKTRFNDSLSFNDKETDLSELFSFIDVNFQNQNIGALVLLSDGIMNKGLNPVYSAEQLKFPIYSIAVGDTNENKDLLIYKINHNQIAYLGNKFAAEVVVNANKLVNEEATLSVYKNGIKKQEQKIKINSENYSKTFQFIFDADAPGIQKYEVTVSRLNNEISYSNNQQSFIVDVIDNREKILLLSNAPHPDIAAISESIENMKNYELVKDQTSLTQKTFKAYSLVIIHGYNALTDAKIMENCNNNNVPVFIINPLTSEGLPNIKINGSLNRYNDTEPTLNKSFSFFTISDELKSFIKQLPALKTFFGNYAVSNGSQVLLNQKIGMVETNDPIFYFNELNGLKNAVFIGDGIWRWKMRNYQENENFNAFNELISKTIQFLSIKGDKSFFRVYTNKIVNENEVIEFNAEVYNKSYELITDPEVSLTIKNKNNIAFSYYFSKINNSYRLNAGLLEPGEYTYEAKVKLDNSMLTKKGILMVKAIVSEQLNTIANHQLLNQLSNATNGKMFQLNNCERIIEEINNNEYIKPITYSENKTIELIELKWIFLVVLFLFTIEWLIRKFNGII